MSNKSTQPNARLADRLNSVRRGRFVGRESELERFRSALLAAVPPFAVLYVYGLGGVGKSTLLREYTRLARENDRPVILLDRDIEPSPPGFEISLRQALGVETDITDDPLAHWPPKAILIIDTYELLEPLDDWLRETFLPQIPVDSLVVIAGRNKPSPAWRTEIAWAELTHFLPLRNLRPEESQTYLAVRGIPEERHAEVLGFTHGHPLALSLVADVLQQGSDLATFNLQDEPDVIRVLLERFTSNIPDSQHRLALEICAHARVTTETLLATILDEDVGHRLFDWLRGLSFIQQGSQGLFPHDLARDVLDTDFRWRNPQAYQAMHRQVRLYYAQELRRRGPDPSLSADLIYQNRYNAAFNPFFNWNTLSHAYIEPGDITDHSFILETIQQHEGPDSMAIARYWLQKQPEALTIFRTAQDSQLGFVLMLNLPSISDADARADPALAVAKTFIQQNGGPLRRDQVLNYVRFWMGRENYQVADIQSLVATRAAGVWMSNEHLAWSFGAVAQADHWEAMFMPLNFIHTGEADFVVGGHQYGVFTHDWRVEPAVEWGYRLEAWQLGLEQTEPPLTAAASPPLITLSNPEFAEAVRQALRDYTRPDMLAANPLLRSRLVFEIAESPGPATLQTLLLEAAGTLSGNPKDQKLYRAIYHTYLEPVSTQEKVAELLDLPFNTYRYHLSNGLKRITTWLWQRELQ